VQDSKRSDDQVATGVGVIIFWPALFFIKGDGASAAELGRLKGEYEALEKLAIKKTATFSAEQVNASSAPPSPGGQPSHP
jgi:hypothetical protein